MNQSKLNTFLAVFLVLATVAIAALAFGLKQSMKDHEEDVRSLGRQKKVSEQRYDSIQILQNASAMKDLNMVATILLYKDSLKQAHTASNKWRTEYAKAKNTRLPADISDHGLDSAITRLLQAR